MNSGGQATRIQGYGLKIELLNGAIEKQYERLGKYEFNTEYKARQEALNRKRKDEARKMAETFEKLAGEFLQNAKDAP